jgi:hypothetical protein
MNINPQEVKAAAAYFEARVIDGSTDRLRVRALIYLDRGADIKEAAKACGVAVTTLENNLIEFVQKYRARQKGHDDPLPLFAA